MRISSRLCANRLRGNQKVGMFRPKICAQRNDLAIAEAGGPSGLKRAQSCYAQRLPFDKYILVHPLYGNQL
jgi:hypothetical protein